MERIGSFLVVAALIVVMVGCRATAAPQCDLTITSNAGGSVTTPGEGTYTCAEGSVINLVATAASGYRFDEWTGDAGTIADAEDASTTITMNADYSITANFEVIPAVQYSLTIDSTAGGSVTTPGEGTFIRNSGTVVSLVADPLSGYQFDEWTGDVGTVDNVNAASTTITMNDNYLIMAVFEETGVTYYNLTTSVSPSGGGSVSPAGGTYAAGSQVTLTATPTSGYGFSNWGGDASGSQNPITITMNSNKSITANFTTVWYTLTTGVSPSGSGSVSPAGGTYAAGSQVTLTATPASGYNFSNWGGDASGSQNPITITMNSNKSITAYFEEVSFMVSAGGYHTVGLEADGTVVAVGYNGNGQCDVGDWTGIIQVDAGNCHTVGLESGGTVVAVGDNLYGQCNVSNVGGWTNIIQVGAGARHTVGLRSNGTVVAVGDNGHGQRNVGNWTGIVQVTAGVYHTVGLKSDGTVVAVGDNDHGQCNVSGWTGIEKVAAGLYHTVGLKSDGTVVAVGDNGIRQCDVSGWTKNIVQVAAGWFHTVGTKSDGTVVAVGADWRGLCNVSSWTSIIQVSAGRQHTVGLRSDGTVVAVGFDDDGQCDVGGWDLS